MASGILLGFAGRQQFNSGRMRLATKFKMVFLILFFVCIAALVMEHKANTRLREDNESLRQQAGQLDQTLVENERLSNLVEKAASPASPEQLKELLRLRNEVGMLRQQTNQIRRLIEENRRLQSAPMPPDSAQSGVDPAAEQTRQISMAKMVDAKTSMLGFIMFAQDNQMRIPTNLVQVDPYLKQSSTDSGRSSLTGTNEYEIVYHGSLRDLTNAASAIVIREKQAWQTANGAWSKTYGFADGHAEIYTREDGNFDDWEKQRLVVPAQPGP
jgi:hypothetical protein